MITEVLLLMFRGIVSLMVGLLPSPEALPEAVYTALENFTSYFIKINKFFPVDTFFQIIGIVLTIEAGILLFKFFNFALKKLRGSG